MQRVAAQTSAARAGPSAASAASCRRSASAACSGVTGFHAHSLPCRPRRSTNLQRARCNHAGFDRDYGHAWANGHDHGHAHARDTHGHPVAGTSATLELPTHGAISLAKSFQTFEDEDVALQLPPRTLSPTASTSKPKLKYETIMLKVSGEALQGSLGFGVDATVMRAVAEEVQRLVHAGVRVAIVVGGGNYFRGANAWQGLERATADYVGMLATVMNALQLQGALEGLGVDTRVQTAIEMREVAEPYIRRRAVAHLNAGRVVIFGAGTGNPFFTTDTAAALRAAEINAQVFIKATKVDGIYDSDPLKNPSAKKYNRLSYRQCTDDSLRVMDETAITLCKENNIPVLVLNMLEEGNILRAVLGEDVGTVVCEGCDME